MKKIILITLAVISTIVIVVFPKDTDYISKERLRKCECIGVKSWETFKDMDIKISYCYGVVHSCTETKL